MHQVILTQRRTAAIGRIVERSTALVHQLDLDPALAEALQPVGIKDPNVTELIRLEALATLLDTVAENAGAPAPAVTDVTVHKFVAPPEQADNVPAAVPAPVETAAEAVAELDEPKPARRSASRTTKKK